MRVLRDAIMSRALNINIDLATLQKRRFSILFTRMINFFAIITYIFLIETILSKDEYCCDRRTFVHKLTLPHLPHSRKEGIPVWDTKWILISSVSQNKSSLAHVTILTKLVVDLSLNCKINIAHVVKNHSSYVDIDFCGRSVEARLTLMNRNTRAQWHNTI